MKIEVRPATVFDDVATMLGPKRPDANVCWCLSYRIASKENISLRGPRCDVGSTCPHHAGSLCSRFFAACDSPVGLDVDMDTFDAIPAIDSLAISHLQPASSWGYWEVRRVMYGAQVPVRIIGSGGPLSRAELSPSAIAELDALAPEVCFSYLAAVRTDEVTTFPHLDALRLFIGAIETMEEAALIVHAIGYFWVDNEQSSPG